MAKRMSARARGKLIDPMIFFTRAKKRECQNSLLYHHAPQKLQQDIRILYKKFMPPLQRAAITPLHASIHTLHSSSRPILLGHSSTPGMRARLCVRVGIEAPLR